MSLSFANTFEEAGSDFKALKEGLYIARVSSLEQKEGTKWQSDEPEMKLIFEFEIIKNAMSKKDVKDVEGKEFSPLTRKLWKWCKPNKQGIFATSWFKSGTGKILTQIGEVFKACGVSVERLESADPGITEEDYLNKVVILDVVNYTKEKTGEVKDKIQAVKVFEGDDKEVAKWVEEASQEIGGSADGFEEELLAAAKDAPKKN